MYSFLTVIYVLLVLVMIIVILMQEPRESGLSPAMGGMQQLLGVRGIPTFFSRLTWALGAFFMVFSLVLATVNPAHRVIKGAESKEKAPFEQKTGETQEQQVPLLPEQTQ